MLERLMTLVLNQHLLLFFRSQVQRALLKWSHVRELSDLGTCLFKVIWKLYDILLYLLLLEESANIVSIASRNVVQPALSRAIRQYKLVKALVKVHLENA